MQLPTFINARLTRRTIAPYQRPTPLFHNRSLSDMVGAERWIKGGDHQTIGPSKVRGGVNVMARRPPAIKALKELLT